MPPRTPTAYAALIAAALGGLGAVAAEVVFSRELALLFGVTAPAAATVVAVYMGGMALGSALGGRLADRLASRAGWLYAGAEALACVWALLFLPLVGLLSQLTDAMPLSWTLYAAALGTAALVGPAALASGATFPALTRALGQEGMVRWLIAANAGGAALGSLLAGLWLPSVLGFSRILWLAGGLSALAGVVMLWAVRSGAPERYAPLPAPVDPVSPRRAAGIYALLGGAGMFAEIGWTRLLEQTGPNPGALTFPLVLATYLAGLGLGGLVLEPRLRRKGEHAALTTCLMLSGASIVAAVSLLPWIPPESLDGHSVGPGPGNQLIFALTGIQVSADRLLIYLGATFLPGLASGAGFPIAASAVSRAQEGLGRGVGRAWAAGTVTAVLASLWMGFLPGRPLGVIRLLVVMGCALLFVAAFTRRTRPAMVLAGASLLALLVPAHAGLQIAEGEELLGLIETASGPSAVTRSTHNQGIRWVYTHGERVPGFPLRMEIPLALHPDPSNVLLIAFGTGVNVPLMLRDQAVDNLVCVDIDPALPQLSEILPISEPPEFDGHRATFVNADGRQYLRVTRPGWDIIYNDVATYAQYVEMGTVEFFTLVRENLAPGGMYTLKIHTDTLSQAGQQRFLQSFLAVFPHAVLIDAHGPLPVLVGFTEAPSLQTLQVRLQQARGLYGEDALQRVLAYPTLDRAGIETMAAGAVSTDDRPIPLRQALVGPYGEGTLSQSGLAPFKEAMEAHGISLGEALFGKPTPLTPSPRSISPPAPPRRAGWFSRGAERDYAQPPSEHPPP